ncbi:myelin-associated glycoprotein-like [Chelmon rostratus]|uniref:myelin-associated glycoprotein-like n=1 Tax=Chelmon rostratus TaxID=109905 RepID=UPI001BE7367C|nr:myelin-associated glycoprotein-like [Chelmon rostratus]
MEKETKMVMLCLLVAALSSPALSEEWKATVVQNLEALVSSCVVVPCSFSHPKENLPSSRLRGIWHRSKKWDERIYYYDNTKVLDNFRGRTRMLGYLGQNNCTLEITDIKDHDNGPFCFRIELARTETDQPTKDMFSFVESCFELTMLPDPPKPTLINPKEALQDHPHTLICSVTHTCPSHRPNLTWSRGTAGDVTEVHKEIHPGYWDLQSILTFIPGETDDHSEITCTAHFNGRKTSSTTLKLHVKRVENYKHIIIPAAVGIGTAIIFMATCIFMVKKYRTRIAELQSQDGSVWNRLSRLSRRMHSVGPRPSRPDQRGPKRDNLHLDHLPNHVKSKTCADQKTSKPRFPSPKSQPKSCNYKEDLDDGDDYMNSAELNIYGNL